MIIVNGEKLYTVADAEVILGIHEVPIRYHIKNGSLRAEKIGKSYLIREEDLREYMEERREKRDARLKKLQSKD